MSNSAVVGAVLICQLLVQQINQLTIDQQAHSTYRNHCLHTSGTGCCNHTDQTTLLHAQINGCGTPSTAAIQGYLMPKPQAGTVLPASTRPTLLPYGNCDCMVQHSLAIFINPHRPRAWQTCQCLACLVTTAKCKLHQPTYTNTSATGASTTSARQSSRR